MLEVALLIFFTVQLCFLNTLVLGIFVYIAVHRIQRQLRHTGSQNASKGNGKSPIATIVKHRKQNERSQRGRLGLNKEKGIAYKQGYQSISYPLLPSKTLTDTLPEVERSTLSACELELLSRQKLWLASKYPKQLAKIISRITKDRRPSPIARVLCLGIGQKSHLTQFVTVLQIVAQLAIANPDILNNLFIHGPDMQHEMHDLLENHGFSVLRNPADLGNNGANTLIFDFYSGPVEEAPRLLEEYARENLLSDVAMYIGPANMHVQRCIECKSLDLHLFYYRQLTLAT